MSYDDEIRQRFKVLKERKEVLSKELNQINVELSALNMILSVKDGIVDPEFEDYPFGGSYEKKVLYSLKSLGKASNKEIWTFIMDRKDRGVSLSSVTVTTSVLAKAGKLEAEKIEGVRAYKYSLKK